MSVATSHIRYLARTGVVTHDLQHPYRFSSWNTVYRELLECFGRAHYHLGQEVSSFEEDADHVAVALANGETDVVNLLVCADGVTSRSRRQLVPDATPRYAGYVAWRGMVPEQSLDATTRDALGDAITYFVYAAIRARRAMRLMSASVNFIRKCSKIVPKRFNSLKTLGYHTVQR